MTSHPTHVSTYEPYEDGIYVMHVFQVKELVLADYDLFLFGKYSHMSKKAKTLILASAKINGVTSQILDRSSKLKEDMVSCKVRNTLMLYISVNKIRLIYRSVPSQ